MFDFSPANLIGNLLFSSIGLVGFVFGKRMNAWEVMFCGLALMIYPYFIGDTLALYAIGVIGTAVLYFLRD